MEFNFNTTSNFDKHINDSINGYGLLDELIMNICSFYAKEWSTIVDLGCTSGRLISKLSKKYPGNSCFGYDITDHNFHESDASLIKQDITQEDFVIPKSHIILSIFTLQFLSYDNRINVLNKIYRSLSNDGVFIICEKEISNTGIFQEVFTFSNYDYKKNNFTPSEILSKETDLRKIMNCLVFGGNEKILKEVGFTKVEPFFQSLNFKGLLCMK